MTEQKEISVVKMLAGVVGAVVENKSLDAALKDVGLSEKYVLSQFVSKSSGREAAAYVKERMTSQFGKFFRDEKSGLYLVKKVYCAPEDFEDFGRVISAADTDKFKVARIISSNPQLMSYKQKNFGLEGYLVSGSSKLEAMRNTTEDEPVFNFSSTNFDASDAGMFDNLITTAVYTHTEDSFERLYEAIRRII